MNHNLVTEPWIPVLFHNGAVKYLGIKETFLQAHSIRQIAATNPMDKLSIIRLLLAILYWCKGNPVDVTNRFPFNWFRKLDDNHEMFALLGEKKRFYQYHTNKGVEKKSSNYLLHENSTGTNHWHFKHTLDGECGLCTACCAMGLVRMPVFTTSGGRGHSPGINATPPIYGIPTSPSLFDTLRSLWKKVDATGIPMWESPGMQLPKKTIPILTGLTWFPKQIWLDTPTTTGHCVNCGRLQPLVISIIYEGIGSMKNEEIEWTDPHVVYTIDAKKKRITLTMKGLLSETLEQVNEKWEEAMAVSDQPMWFVALASVKNKYYEVTERFTTGGGSEDNRAVY